jgi:hypothetical protein
MAGGAVLDAGGDKDYPGKLTMFVLLACIVAATGGLIFGYDIGISGKSPSLILTHPAPPRLPFIPCSAAIVVALRVRNLLRFRGRG